ncbi:MAG: hypothetical protein JKX76_01765 [Colwellia sp.]|nr:hypothetical protein [Colwellia sp.]
MLQTTENPLDVSHQDFDELDFRKIVPEEIETVTEYGIINVLPAEYIIHVMTQLTKIFKNIKVRLTPPEINEMSPVEKWNLLQEMSKHAEEGYDLFRIIDNSLLNIIDKYPMMSISPNNLRSSILPILDCLNQTTFNMKQSDFIKMGRSQQKHYIFDAQKSGWQGYEKFNYIEYDLGCKISSLEFDQQQNNVVE